jgi:hypothetical protein
MGSIKNRIVATNRYDPTPEMKRRAHRDRKGLFTAKKKGDILFDEGGRCFEVQHGGSLKPYSRVA